MDGVGELLKSQTPVKVINIIIFRDSSGNLAANVPKTVVHHSDKSNWEIGDDDGGRSDLALNICNYLFPGEEIECRRGKCSSKAFSIHQDFETRFLSSMFRDGGLILKEDIHRWLTAEGLL